MVKKDGHTHTQFCPHGSGDNAQQMIEKAIKMGFTEYSITEHAPLPPAFKRVFEGELEGLVTASLTADQVVPYLEFAQQMQAKYAQQIKVNVGFEVDYLPGFEDWTTDFLNRYGSRTQDNILSVHFMPGTHDKFWCVDYTTADFAKGFAADLHQPQTLFHHFLQLEYQAVTADLGAYKPQRMGHLTLIRKYQDWFNLPRQFNSANKQLMLRILKEIRDRHYQIDLNTAGLYKEYCNEVYPDQWIIKLAQEMQIPLVFGSDAHSIQEVGHGYHQIERWVAPTSHE